MLPSDAIVKHWVLNLAVNFPVPLRLLFPVVRAEALNVKEIPGFVAKDYLAALQKLLMDDMVQISPPEDASAPDWGDTIRSLRHLPVASSSETVTLPGGQTSFELTSRGGASWEGLAKPDWDHILIERSDLESCELIASDRNQLMAYMGWYQGLHDQAIDLHTVKVTPRTNFPILYWKRLASVYHASFRLKSPTAAPDSGQPLWTLPWFREWARLRWYRDPWDLPGWHR